MSLDAFVVRDDDNYFGLDPELADLNASEFVVMQAPFEGTVSYGKGTARGPDAIRHASQQVELYDEITNANHIERHGVCTLQPFDVRCSATELHQRVLNMTRGIVALDKTPVLVGGEHSVSTGAVEACSERHLEFSVLQIDAHSDLRDSYQGDKHSHACAAARFNEVAPIVQMGIRSREKPEPGHPDRPVHCYPAWQYHEPGAWIDEAISKLTRNVYLTIDVDGFDPSVFPGTGTPEPGGLSWYLGLTIIEKLARARNIVGFDIVEVSPIKGQQVSEFAAARLMSRIIAFIGQYNLNVDGAL